MQLNNLKLKSFRKKKKTVGRGGKKGTYSGRGNKGQKARTGAHVDPLFEGGRSTLIDHMKKKRGFKSNRPEKNIVRLSDLEKKSKTGDKINLASLIKSGLVDKMKARNGVKIIGAGKVMKKLEISKDIFLSKQAKALIEKAGGKIIR